MENQFKNIYKNSTSTKEFYNGLRTYPFRIEQTAVLGAFDVVGTYIKLSKCTSISDSTGVSNCADPMKPTNWIVVGVSLFIIAFTITIWVFGYKFAGKYEEIQKMLAE